MGHEIENDEVIQPHRGDQGQVSGPQVPLPGHGDEIENQNWVYREQLGTQTPALQGTMEKIEIFGEFEMKMSQHEF